MANKVSTEIGFDQMLDELITEIIRKTDGKYCLYSKKKTKAGKRRKLGCYSSKAGVKQREREVQYFKHA